MIQFKRGSTENWHRTTKPLASGQPGYDKDKKKIKIGDGEHSWQELPYASGLSAEEILSSETDAKIKRLLDPGDSPAVITYGTDVPNKNTVGQIYLQYYDTEPEVDYIIASGLDGIWTYEILNSGIAKCWGTLPLRTAVQNSVGNGYLFTNNIMMKNVKYPFTFKTDPNIPLPNETANLISDTNKIVWLAGRGPNSTTHTGLYTILSFDKQVSANYNIVFDVKGYIDMDAWKKRK